MLRRFRGDFLLIIVIVAFAVSLVAGFDRMIREEKRRTTQQGKETWVAVQAEVELLKLQQVLDRYVVGDDDVAIADVRLHFDLFWSRLSVLAEGEESARLRDEAGVGELASGMLADLSRIDGLLANLGPQVDANYYRVRETLDAMRAPLHSLVQDTVLDAVRFDAAVSERAGSTFSKLVVYFIGILIAGAFLIGLLLRENHRSRMHLALAQSAEAMASQARGRLEDAIEAISEGFLLCDRNDRILLFNRRYRDEIHQGRTNVSVGSRFEDGVREALATGIIDTGGRTDEEWLAWRMAQRRATGTAVEVRIQDGSWVHIHEYRTRDGGLVTLYTNVTKLKQREEALRSAKEEAEIANRSKSDFLANISHELRTPLNAIIGFADMLADGVIGELAPKQREYAVDIRASGHHLLEIINDILDLSKAEAGRLTLDERPFDLMRSIDGALRLVQPRASDEGVSVAVDAPPYDIGVVADELKLRQILLNLLSNAIKFTPAGGAVTVRVRRGMPPTDGVKVSAAPPPLALDAPQSDDTAAQGAEDRAPEACLLISVDDTGIGMTAEEVEQVFQPFVQVDSGLNRRYQGTGLGLPLTRRLAELHGGSLVVHSARGQGTRVTVVLPGDRMLDGANLDEQASNLGQGA